MFYVLCPSYSIFIDFSRFKIWREELFKYPTKYEDDCAVQNYTTGIPKMVKNQNSDKYVRIFSDVTLKNSYCKAQ